MRSDSFYLSARARTRASNLESYAFVQRNRPLHTISVSSPINDCPAKTFSPLVELIRRMQKKKK